MMIKEPKPGPEIELIFEMAKKFASERSSPTIGTLHVLLVLTTLETDKLIELFHLLKVDRMTLKIGVEQKLFNRSPSWAVPSPLLESHVQRALIRGTSLAHEFGFPEVGSIHLLYGIASDPWGTAGRFLAERGVTSNLIRSVIRQFSRKAS